MGNFIFTPNQIIRMKHSVYLLLILFIFSCSTPAEKKDYVTFSGKVNNPVKDTLYVFARGFEKAMVLQKDGTFSDTLKVTNGTYYFSDGNENTVLYLKNGDDLKITFDTNTFDESLTYQGQGAINNNYLAKKAIFEQDLFSEDFSTLNEEELDIKVDEVTQKLNVFISNNKEVDTVLTNLNKLELNEMMKGMKAYYLEGIALKKELPKGKKSPLFENYETVDGGSVSLSDFEGKNVYIDVWATWCVPCIAEIPFLKELEHDYEGKDIAFVSLSIDDDRSHKGSWDLAREKWKKMVEEKSLGGVQLFAPQGWNSSFITAYKIKGIPRFILIDKEGNIITADAPRPSSESIRSMFDALL